ncbi:MAG: hypothetical protein P0Y49_20300 [Candidatus Pedobacter colombiensis]|uniref:Uncharacterized protein n=1 Tax=Candidatus Pedobacter colombiensis TaxID=3121371 RepID=A0AAJ5WA65_9SPHI|nr:hypothetical protein [Pedobacter sp.]WEK19122.1 MAG: hypothetical protein P0Y49_20300 [Pedobacter sp.]
MKKITGGTALDVCAVLCPTGQVLRINTGGAGPCGTNLEQWSVYKNGTTTYYEALVVTDGVQTLKCPPQIVGVVHPMT